MDVADDRGTNSEWNEESQFENLVHNGNELYAAEMYSISIQSIFI